MSYHPKKFKARRDKPNNKGYGENTILNKPYNFVNRQYENLKTYKDSVILKSFESINEKMKKYSPKKFIVDKYKKFSESVKNPGNRKLLALLPAVLLSITYLAVKNKNLIRPFIESFYITRNRITPNMSMTDKVLLIIYEYGNILYNNMNILTTFDAVSALLILFLEDIPNLLSKLDSYTGISVLQMQRNIRENAKDLQENLIDKPYRERKKKEEEEKRQKKYKEQLEEIKRYKQEQQRKEQQELKELRAMKQMGYNPKNTTKQQKFSKPAKNSHLVIQKY